MALLSLVSQWKMPILDNPPPHTRPPISNKGANVSSKYSLHVFYGRYQHLISAYNSFPKQVVWEYFYPSPLPLNIFDGRT